jgi:hypothetical protein
MAHNKDAPMMHMMIPCGMPAVDNPDARAAFERFKADMIARHGPSAPIFGKEKPKKEDILRMVKSMVDAGELPPEAMQRFQHFGDPTMANTMACTACNTPASSLCANCRIQIVCSTACQRKAWPEHKRACAIARAALAAPPALPDIEVIFREDGEDEVPIPAGVAVFAVIARVGGLVVGKATGALVDCSMLADPVTTMDAVWGASSNESDVLDVSRRLFTWGTGNVPSLGAAWPPTAPRGKERVLIVSFLRVPFAWRRRGIGSAILRALFASPRGARHTLAVLKNGVLEEDRASGRSDDDSSGHFFTALGFRLSPLAYTDLFLRPADAAHPARSSSGKMTAELEMRRFGPMSAARAAVAALPESAPPAARRRAAAEAHFIAAAQTGGALARSAFEADMASLTARWPRAVAAARARGFPPLLLLHVRTGTSARISVSDDDLNWHMCAYDEFGELDERAAAELGIPPHPRFQKSGINPSCPVA